MDHVNKLCQRTYPKFGLFNRISFFLPKVILLRIYRQTILPILDYGSIVWHEKKTTEPRAMTELFSTKDGENVHKKCVMS